MFANTKTIKNAKSIEATKEKHLNTIVKKIIPFDTFF